MAEQVVVPERFRGPSDSGNGGYVCGLVARRIDGPASVSLRAPAPLERPLEIEPRGGGELELRDGELLVAEGGPAELRLDVPDPPSRVEAEEGMHRFPWWEGHPFSSCFVCGPDREDGDGMRVFPGQVEGRDIVASPWTPDPGLAGDHGTLPPELVWAVLDCPTYFGAGLQAPLGKSVLARLTADLRGEVRAGEPHIVVGWPISRSDRKSEGGAAVFNAEGRALGCSRGLWIRLKGQ